MALLEELNSTPGGDKFPEMYAKINEAIQRINSVLGGGNTGQAIKKVSSADFDFQFYNVADTANYSDRKSVTADKSGLAMPFGGEASTGSILCELQSIETDSVKRDYILCATIEFSRITTSPEMQWCLYKDNVQLKSFKFVPIPTNGHTQTVTITYMDKNTDPGSEYQVRIKSDGNQSAIGKFHFYIDGQKAL